MLYANVGEGSDVTTESLLKGKLKSKPVTVAFFTYMYHGTSDKVAWCCVQSPSPLSLPPPFPHSFLSLTPPSPLSIPPSLYSGIHSGHKILCHSKTKKRVSETFPRCPTLHLCELNHWLLHGSNCNLSGLYITGQDGVLLCAIILPLNAQIYLYSSPFLPLSPLPPLSPPSPPLLFTHPILPFPPLSF